MLKKVCIEGYRSICDEQCISIPGLTIIIGPNASGKTTVLEAITKLALLEKLTRSKEIDLRSVFDPNEINEYKGKAIITYFMDNTMYRFMWVKTNVEILVRPEDVPLPELPLVFPLIEIRQMDPEDLENLRANIRELRSRLADVPIIKYFLHRSPMKASSILKGLPDIESDDEFERVCANILYNILGDEGLRNRLINELKYLGYDGINIEKKQDKLYLKVRDIASNKWVYLEYSADGLRYSLPFIVDLVVLDRQALFLIDDIELGLHPSVVIEIAKFFTNAVADGGLYAVITTHSEVFLYSVILEVLKDTISRDKVALYVAYRDEDGCTRYSRFEPTLPLQVDKYALKALERMGAMGIFEEASKLIADVIRYYAERKRA